MKRKLFASVVIILTLSACKDVPTREDIAFRVCESFNGVIENVKYLPVHTYQVNSKNTYSVLDNDEVNIETQRMCIINREKVGRVE